ncbi:YidC/Oxa1 family membrane protein insertase [Williamsia limnetica]|uniref:Membrane protein insertase YidC n=1 Tax=Williamsia limnetica TaxID=882452 RepID=A0A318RR92_WILLI|nr:membrane protein insertase YidC [Williamsia limnetica]PYE19210.1 YidC/Oxa1 family membrane protein insertase [Williamsia limnetica]
MLDLICYPVSAILWFWHKIFAFILHSPDSGIGWSLAVIFLVFTIRVALIRPFVKQMRTQRDMKKLQPQIEELRRTHRGDRRKLAAKMQELQRANGVNPMLGCLPVLIQIPVFFGLYHVLRSFDQTAGGAYLPFFGSNPMTIEQNVDTPNYIFSASDVQSFLDAKLFGAPLSAMITMPGEQLEAFGDVSRLAIALVAIPLMVAAAVATHITARANRARGADASDSPQSVLINRLAVWAFPAGAIVGGPFLPIAILLYWLANNCWTLAQQHIVLRRLDAEDAAAQAVVMKSVETADRVRPDPGKGRRRKR